MENNFTMEVLLITNTQFSKKEYVERNEHPLKPNLPQNKLADACWSGLVPVILPDLFKHTGNKNLIMWQLEEGRECLYMQIGEQPLLPEADFGLHPWMLLESSGQN